MTAGAVQEDDGLRVRVAGAQGAGGDPGGVDVLDAEGVGLISVQMDMCGTP